MRLQNDYKLWIAEPIRFTNPFAEIFRWGSKAWGVTGYVSKGNNLGDASVTTRKIIATALWNKSYNDIDARGDLGYLFGCFCFKGKPGET